MYTVVLCFILVWLCYPFLVDFRNAITCIVKVTSLALAQSGT